MSHENEEQEEKEKCVDSVEETSRNFYKRKKKRTLSLCVPRWCAIPFH